MIDLDAQANLTTSLTKEQPDETIYHALTGRYLLSMQKNSNAYGY